MTTTNTLTAELALWIDRSGDADGRWAALVEAGVRASGLDGDPPRLGGALTWLPRASPPPSPRPGDWHAVHHPAAWLLAPDLRDRPPRVGRHAA